MKMIRPKLKAPTITIAEDQEEFKPVTAALVYNRNYPAVKTEHGPINTIVLAFRPTPEERQKLADGEDIYISLLTFLQPMQGIIVSAGSWEPSAMFNVATESDNSP